MDVNKFDWQSDTWKVIKKMFNCPKFLVCHQIDSYNHFLDKSIGNIVEQFNPINLNYDYIDEQVYYKLSDECITKLSKVELIKYKDLLNWVEYKDCKESFEENLFNTINSIYINKNEEIKSLDLAKQLSNNTENDKINKIDIFIKNNLVIKKIPVNKHRYELEINISNPILAPAVINENNGVKKLMYPSEARLRNFTYSGKLFVDVSYKTKERMDEGLSKTKISKVKHFKKINMGKIPIMLYSKACILNNKSNNNNKDHEECLFDQGGYFIINGSEKVIVSQERVAENKVYVFKNSKQQSKFALISEIKSIPDKKILTPKNIQVKISNKSGINGRTIKVSLPHIKQDIPLFIIFRALGIITDKHIIECITLGQKKNYRKYCQLLRGSLYESCNILSKDDAIEFLIKYVNMMGYNRDQSEYNRRIIYLNDILNNDLLPHISTNNNIDNNNIKKAYFLGYMVKKLLDVYISKKNYDDRDSYMNKRIDTAGVLMSNLFRQYFTKLIKDMKTQINKEFSSGSWKATNEFNDIINLSNIYKIIKSSTITTGLKYALATGNWGIKCMSNKQGIAQVLSRLTYNSTLSHLRRVNTPMEKTSKLVAPRKLHGTQFMRICPSETPEGGSVGVVKNMALSCSITIYSDKEIILNLLKNFNVKSIIKINITDIHKYTYIFVNGDWKYVTDNPKKLHKDLIHLRRIGIINIFVSVIWDINNNG